MKKFLSVLLIVCLVLVSGCEKVSEEGTYKEGVYEGEAVDNYNNEVNTATAKVTVDKDGKITEVYLDTTYTQNGVETTKKALGDAYGMKTGNSSYGSADYEWFEQVEALEKAVVENQGIDFLNLDIDGYTDAVSTCTIKIDALYLALYNALDQAK